MSENILGNLYTLLARVIVLFTVIPLHECAHGWVAWKLGDPTAKSQNRLTLNPLRHFDPIGSVLMLLTGFGWAKAVPVNPGYFKNPKKGMAITAAAGPLSNLVMGFFLLLLYKILGYGALLLGVQSSLYFGVISILLTMASINVSLAVFNLLPIPPLDGSRIITLFMPQKMYFQVMKYERYIFFALFIVMATGVLSRPISYLVNWVFMGLDRLTMFVNLGYVWLLSMR